MIKEGRWESDGYEIPLRVGEGKVEQEKPLL